MADYAIARRIINLHTKLEVTVVHEQFEAALSQSAKDSKLALGNFSVAGQLCAAILGRNKELWQEEGFKFCQLKHLRAVAPHLLCSLDNKLEGPTYKRVLLDSIIMPLLVTPDNAMAKRIDIDTWLQVIPQLIELPVFPMVPASKGYCLSRTRATNNFQEAADVLF